MRLELARQQKLGGLEAIEWDPDRIMGIVAEATGRVLTCGLSPAHFFEEDEDQVRNYLNGIVRMREGGADAFFVPPPKGDEGTEANNYSPMPGDMGDHRRAYLVIKEEGSRGRVWCAPAIIFAEADDEEVGDFLERMKEMMGTRLFVVPQGTFLEETDQVGGRLDEFDSVVDQDGSHSVRRVRLRNSQRVIGRSLSVDCFIDIAKMPGLVEGSKSYEDLWELLEGSKWKGVALFDLLQNGSLSMVEDWMANKDSPTLLENWLPANMYATEAEEYVSNLIKQGFTIEGLTQRLSTANIIRRKNGKRPVVLQAVSPGGSVVMLPFGVCLEIENRIARKMH